MRATVASGFNSAWVGSRYYSSNSIVGPPCVVIYAGQITNEVSSCLQALRAQLDCNLFCKFSGHDHLAVFPVFLPTPGKYLGAVFDFVVTAQGIQQDLGSVFENCYQFSKFASPACSNCSWSKCLELSGSPLHEGTRVVVSEDRSYNSTWRPEQAWHPPYQGAMTTSLGDTRRDSKNLLVPNYPLAITQMTQEDLQNLAASLWSAIKEVGLEVVPTKWSNENDFRSASYLPRPQHVSLSQGDIDDRKKALSEKSQLSAKSAKAKKDLCSKCAIASTCNKFRPYKCDEAISLDRIKDYVKARVKAHLGEVPTKDTPWVKMTLATSGMHVEGRIFSKYGRPTKYVVAYVRPERDSQEFTVVLRRARWSRNGYVHKTLNDKWSNWKPQELLDLMATPPPTITDDQALWLAYLISLSGWRRPFGSYDCCFMYKTNSSGGITVTTDHYRRIVVNKWEDLHSHLWSDLRRLA